MPHRKIVIIDGYTMCAYPPGEAAPVGEPDWSGLAELGELVYYPRTAKADTIEQCREAQAVLTNKVVFDAEVIGRLPQLAYLGVTATGTNVVDLAAAEQAEIVVTNVPDYSTASVAQHVFALLLELSNRVAEHDAAVHGGEWSRSADFAFARGPIIELAGLTLGIVGFGAIGQAVARIGHGFGMQVAVHSRTRRDFDLPLRWCGLDELFELSDVLTLHCPLTDETQHLVNAERIERMKRGTYLINTGRGPLVDEPALAAALEAGRLAGAGLDVLSAEPPPAENPLLSAPRCVITPHNAWMSQAARRRLMRIVTDNLRAFLTGEPVNVVRSR